MVACARGAAGFDGVSTAAEDAAAFSGKGCVEESAEVDAAGWAGAEYETGPEEIMLGLGGDTASTLPESAIYNSSRC